MANQTPSERMAHARSFRKPKVEIKEAPRTVSDEEAFVMGGQGSLRSRETFAEDGDSAVITHTRPGRVLMWKPGTDGHYTPRLVADSARAINLRAGWKTKCPACNTNHEDSPYPPGDPNSCPARDPIAFRTCPVCGKRIHDNMVTITHEVDALAPDSGMAIKDDTNISTPESRTRVQLDRHLWQFHPRNAEAMGRPPLPTATRQFDGNVRPV